MKESEIVTNAPKAAQPGLNASWDARRGEIGAFPFRGDAGDQQASSIEKKSIESGSVETNLIEKNGDLSQLREAGQCHGTTISQDFTRPASRGDPLAG